MSQTFFATIAPGLEDALLAEVRELGGRRARLLRGGVEFEASQKKFYELLLRVRCANRVVMRLDEFRARDFPELFQKSARLDWRQWLGVRPVEVRASAARSRLIHTSRIAQTVREAIDGGRCVDPGQAPLTVFARLEDDRCQLSLDASGTLLYQRGWRTDAARAPLRESTAAALLRLSGWTVDQTIVDPTCGSGTFVIEAAQRARGIWAGRDRAFAVEGWANLREDDWQKARQKARAEQTSSMFQGWGFDLEARMVEASKANAARAGVGDELSFATRAAEDLEPCGEAPGWVFANPPYDRRIRDGGTVAKALLQRVRDFPNDWRMGMLYPSAKRWKVRGLEITPRAEFSHGGISVTWWLVRPSER